MMNRTDLYAHAIRNTLGRAVGAASAYTLAQRATAKAMWDAFAAAGHDGETCAALLGNVDGETSFLLGGRGDRGEAGGAAQWHQNRRALILANTKIDVWKDVDPVSQARAVLAETTQRWSWYKHVDGALRAARGLQAKVMVLVALYEQSGSQARDVARRTAMASYWYAQFSTPVVANMSLPPSDGGSPIKARPITKV